MDMAADGPGAAGLGRAEVGPGTEDDLPRIVEILNSWATTDSALPNDASVALHRKFGFTEVGTFREYAVKNGHYISSVWMQRLAAS
jgi:hypothetical protein